MELGPDAGVSYIACETDDEYPTGCGHLDRRTAGRCRNGTEEDRTGNELPPEVEDYLDEITDTLAAVNRIRG